MRANSRDFLPPIPDRGDLGRVETTNLRTDSARWTEERVRALVLEHEDALRAYLLALGCPRDTVDDVVQETFLRFLSAAPVERLESVGAYLRTVARHAFLKTRAPAAADVGAIDVAWGRVVGDDDGDWLGALRACLGALAPRSRRILGWRYEEGASTEELSARSGLAPSGVKSLLHRAKGVLRDCVRRRLSP